MWRRSGPGAVASVDRRPTSPHNRARHITHRMLATTYDAVMPPVRICAGGDPSRKVKGRPYRDDPSSAGRGDGTEAHRDTAVNGRASGPRPASQASVCVISWNCAREENANDYFRGSDGPRPASQASVCAISRNCAGGERERPFSWQRRTQTAIASARVRGLLRATPPGRSSATREWRTRASIPGRGAPCPAAKAWRAGRPCAWRSRALRPSRSPWSAGRRRRSGPSRAPTGWAYR